VRVGVELGFLRTFSPLADLFSIPGRVTFVTQEFFPRIGGAATVVAELAFALTVFWGKEVSVLAPGKPCRADGEVPYRVERTGTRGRQDWPDRISLIRHLRSRKWEEGEEVIFADPGAVRAALYVRYLGVRLPRPPILILHGSEILRLTIWPHRRRLFGKLVSHCQRVQVLSHCNRNLLMEKLPGLRVPIIVSPGAPSRKPSPETGRRPTGRKDSDSLLTILTVGRIHPRKGQLDTLTALSRLPIAEQRKIRYRVVGPCVRPRYREKILRLASKCSFPVEMAGALDEKALESEYKAADIFALTSRQDKLSVEGFGLVYLDASAYGIPVVATRSGGIPEAVIDQKTGLLADEGAINQIAECLCTLIRDDELRRQIGEQGRIHAASHSWKETAKALIRAD